MNHRHAEIVIGAQWGDEGKGKWVDILSEGAAAVARYQGGNNAGHTLYVDNQKHVLHQIPSGIFRKDLICALTAGVVVSPQTLLHELRVVRGKIDVTPDRLWISARAHVITPWTVYLDSVGESQRRNPIGTTRRGIGPTYAEKATRNGLRLGHYVDQKSRREWIERSCEYSKDFAVHLEEHADEWAAFEAAAKEIAPYVNDAEHELRAVLHSGKRVLLEGAQGALLDIDHGTFPYVTSSSTAAGGALASLGFSPKCVNKIYGIAKAYATRVGEGPFPTELFDAAGKHLSRQGNEFGATTGRPRRCGWLDAVALRYAAEVNGLDELILNKLDVLTGLDEIFVATAYEHPEIGQIRHFPWDHRVLEHCTPVLERFAGWSETLPEHGKINDLPAAAKEYVMQVSHIIGVPITKVGTGVHRENALFA